ncbi:MAG: Maf family protein [Pseudomonadota bacterium]
MTKPLILASGSPRRQEILNLLGASYDIQPANIDETPGDGELAEEYVRRMAHEKALNVAAAHASQEHIAVLAADTTVVVDGDVLGKPVDRLDGLAMLARLSGRIHQVMTAVCLVSDTDTESICVATDVEFVTLSRATCEAYLSTDEPWDKAGGYGIQGLAGAFVKAIRGSYSNVVGLPMAETQALLVEAGIATKLGGEASQDY